MMLTLANQSEHSGTSGVKSAPFVPECYAVHSEIALCCRRNGGSQIPDKWPITWME